MLRLIRGEDSGFDVPGLVRPQRLTAIRSTSVRAVCFGYSHFTTT